MATTAGTIIDQARDYSPLFTQRAIPDLVALRVLARLERQLAEAVLMENPDALSIWGDLFTGGNLPSTWADGITLPANLLVTGVDLEYKATVAKGRWYVELASPGQSLTQPHFFPTAYVMGSKLFLADLRDWFGDTLHGWEDVDNLRVRYVPVLGALTGLATNISLPDTAVPALVALLALWMADRTGVKLPALREDAPGAGAAWVAAMANLGSTRSWQVERVE